MPVNPNTQTSAQLGTAILGRTVLGVVLDATGRLPPIETGRVNPWSPRAAVTTT